MTATKQCSITINSLPTPRFLSVTLSHLVSFTEPLTQLCAGCVTGSEGVKKEKRKVYRIGL